VTSQIKAILTDEDIVCYKIVKESGIYSSVLSNKYPYSSLYNNFLWELGKVNYTKLEISIRDLSSCKFYDSRARWGQEISGDRNFVQVSCGFHAALTYYRLSNNYSIIRDELIVECLIPKGSLIFKDTTGLIVSDQMIMVKQCSGN